MPICITASKRLITAIGLAKTLFYQIVYFFLVFFTDYYRKKEWKKGEFKGEIAVINRIVLMWVYVKCGLAINRSIFIILLLFFDESLQSLA